MYPEMAEFFRCPQRGTSLRLETTKVEDGRVVEGSLVSDGTPVIEYPIVKGVPRFVDVDEIDDEKVRSTTEAFSVKWSRIPEYASGGVKSKQNRESWYFERFGFERGEKDLKTFLRPCEFILEAGTGAGVDTDLLMRSSHGLVFGIDIGDCIDIAYERFAESRRICLAQADLGLLPFGEGFFDAISCDQVLHHTSDPPRNFSHLASRLRVGGRMLVYVYNRKAPVREFSDDYLRERVTMSPLQEAIEFSEKMAKLGHQLSALHATINLEEDIPELQVKAGSYDLQRFVYDHIVKCFWNDDYDLETNAMVNFDWYRPPYAYRYTPDEVREWVVSGGMELVYCDECASGISVIVEK